LPAFLINLSNTGGIQIKVVGNKFEQAASIRVFIKYPSGFMILLFPVFVLKLELNISIFKYGVFFIRMNTIPVSKDEFGVCLESGDIEYTNLCKLFVLAIVNVGFIKGDEGTPG